MRIKTAEEFGKLIRKARKKLKISQATLAASSGTGVRFIRDLEQGKASCHLQKALFVAKMLGIKFEMISPE